MKEYVESKRGSNELINMKQDAKPIKYYRGIFDYYKANAFHLELWFDTTMDKTDFADLMWGLGYDMDCKKSYVELYPESSEFGMTAIQSYDNVLDNLEKCERQIVGNYIFSEFRYLTHWSYGYDSSEAAYFFEKAFRLLEQKYKEEKEFKGNASIDFLDLSPATYNALIKQHVDTPKKIANLTDRDIDRLRAIGDKRKEEVLAAREKCKEYKLDQYKVYLNDREIGSFEVPASAEEVKVELDRENKELRISNL